MNRVIRWFVVMILLSILFTLALHFLDAKSIAIFNKHPILTGLAVFCLGYYPFVISFYKFKKSSKTHIYPHLKLSQYQLTAYILSFNALVFFGSDSLGLLFPDIFVINLFITILVIFLWVLVWLPFVQSFFDPELKEEVGRFLADLEVGRR